MYFRKIIYIIKAFHIYKKLQSFDNLNIANKIKYIMSNLYSFIFINQINKTSKVYNLYGFIHYC